jgi:hypothetical protein
VHWALSRARLREAAVRTSARTHRFGLSAPGAAAPATRASSMMCTALASASLPSCATARELGAAMPRAPHAARVTPARRRLRALSRAPRLAAAPEPASACAALAPSASRTQRLPAAAGGVRAQERHRPGAAARAAPDEARAVTVTRW